MDGNKNLLSCDEETEDGFVFVGKESPQCKPRSARKGTHNSTSSTNVKVAAEATEQTINESYELEEEHEEGWYKKYCRWSPTSPTLLAKSEKQILSYVKTPNRGFYVDIGMDEGNYHYQSSLWSSGKSEERKIWTVVFNETKLNDETIPLVLIHGLCAAVGLWAVNIDGLSKDRAVYAIDLLGFGRSSRPKFSTKPEEAEMQHIEAIEAWTRQLGLKKFVMLGHSMGAFISAAYALRFPQKVLHLICADPWGFTRKSEAAEENFRDQAKRNVKLRILTTVGNRWNPLAAVRAAGPMGRSLILKARPDLMTKFECLNQNGHADVADYIFHCNAQKPTGEEAFRAMMDFFGWAKNPIHERIHELNVDIGLTVIYGGNSWIKRIPDDDLQLMRPEEAFTDIYTIPLAGHHVYLDDKSFFNQIVNTVGEMVDNLSTS